MLVCMSGVAENLPTRKSKTSEIKGVSPRGISALAQKRNSRNLKGKKHKNYEDDYYYEEYYKQKKKGKKYKNDKKKHGKGKGKGKKKKKGHYNEEDPDCETVVEPAEFIFHNYLSAIVPGNSSGSGSIGTQYIYQGPLLDSDLKELEGYFISGLCTRIFNSTNDIPGAAFCQMTITIITGACINVAGEVFDDWTNNLAITGGTFEMQGVYGQATLIAVDDDLRPEQGDFFDSQYIHGRATLVYEVCPEGYWDPLIADEQSDLEGGTYPDPFGLEED